MRPQSKAIEVRRDYPVCPYTERADRLQGFDGSAYCNVTRSGGRGGLRSSVSTGAHCGVGDLPLPLRTAGPVLVGSCPTLRCVALCHGKKYLLGGPIAPIRSSERSLTLLVEQQTGDVGIYLGVYEE